MPIGQSMGIGLAPTKQAVALVNPGRYDPYVWLEPEQNKVFTGGSRAFNGTNQYLSIADNASLSMGDIDMTVLAWVYPTSLPGGSWKAVCGKYALGGGPTACEFELSWWDINKAWQFGVGNGVSTGNCIARSAGNPVVNHWYLLIGWHSASENRTYISVNNQSLDVLSWTLGIQDGANDFAIGVLGGHVANWFAGRIARCAIYKRVLTAAERTFIWESGRSLTYGDIGVAGTDGSDLKTSLVSWWNLNEASGNAIDQHGSNDLTDNNSVSAAAGVTTRARQYTLATTEFHSLSHHEDFSPGADSFFISTWINPDSFPAGYGAIIQKVGTGSQREWALLNYGGADLAFYVSTNGTTYAPIIRSGSAPTLATWTHALVWKDSDNDFIHMRINDDAEITPVASTAEPPIQSASTLAIGKSVSDSNYWDGRIGRTVFGKPPTAIAALIDAIHERFWNDGDACDHTELTDAERAAWGVVSVWDGDEVSGNLIDKIGRRARYHAKASDQGWSSANTSADIGTSDFSFEFMGKMDSFSNSPIFLINGASPAGTMGIIAAFNTVGYFNFQFSDDVAAGNVGVTATIPATVDDWIHYVVNGDRDGLMSLYINGKTTPDATVDISSFSGNVNQTYPPAWGRSGAAAPSNRWDGDICHVRLRTRLMTADEIVSSYNSGHGKTHNELTDAEKVGLKISWDSNERSGYVIDRSGNGWHGTPVNSPTSAPGPTKNVMVDTIGNNNGRITDRSSAASAWSNDVPSAIGTGYSLRCRNDSYNLNLGSIAAGNPLMLNDSAFTFALWIKTTASIDFLARLIDKSTGASGTNGYAWYVSAGKQSMEISGTAQVGVVAIAEGVWTHVAVTRAAGAGAQQMIFYTAGAHDVTATIGSPPNVTANARIGAWQTDTTRSFDGWMDDVRIYNRVLSAAEIAVLAAGGEPPATGLVGHWKFDEGPGIPPAYDMADNNTVTVANGPGSEAGMVVDGDVIQRIESKGTAPYYVQQLTGAKKPFWDEIDPVFNNRPVIVSDGTDDWLLGPAFAANMAVPFSQILVCRIATYKNYNVVTTERGTDNRLQVASDITNQYIYNGAAANFGITDTNPHILAIIWNGASSRISVDGGAFSTVNPGVLSAALTGVSILANATGTATLNGRFAEGAWYNGAMDEDTLLALANRYFKTKYGIS